MTKINKSEKIDQPPPITRRRDRQRRRFNRNLAGGELVYLGPSGEVTQAMKNEKSAKLILGY